MTAAAFLPAPFRSLWLVLCLALCVGRYRRRPDGARCPSGHAGHSAPARRGLASGAIFTGVGLGIAASGTLVPLLMHGAWSRPGSALAGSRCCSPPSPGAAGRASSFPQCYQPTPRSLHARTRARRALCRIRAERDRSRAAHDFPRRLCRARARAGAVTGGDYWVLFGIGAVLGPLVAGGVGDRIGFRTALRCAFVVQARCVALPLFSASALTLAISSFVVGAMVPGFVAITLGRTRELIPHDRRAGKGLGLVHDRLCARASGRRLRLLLHLCPRRSTYRVLFLLGAAALAMALAIDCRGPASTRPRRAVRG